MWCGRGIGSWHRLLVLVGFVNVVGCIGVARFVVGFLFSIVFVCAVV